jgi:hypothetical protein
LREDDYRNAIGIATKDLLGRDPLELARAGGARANPSFLEFRYFGSLTRIALPSLAVSWAPPREADPVPLTDQALILHYFQGAKGLPPTGDFVAFREIPGGGFYSDAFRRRAEIPLAQAFGERPGLFPRAAAALGGTPAEGPGDEAAVFRALPHLDLLAMIYLADEEFGARGQVLFDKVIGGYLPTEDIAWLGSGLVHGLMAAAKGLAP